MCLARGFAATRIELAPCLTAVPGSRELPVLSEAWPGMRFSGSFNHSRGVIEGVRLPCGHAVAYEYGHIFDPDGCEYDLLARSLRATGFLRLDTSGASTGSELSMASSVQRNNELFPSVVAGDAAARDA